MTNPRSSRAMGRNAAGQAAQVLYRFFRQAFKFVQGVPRSWFFDGFPDQLHMLLSCQ